MLSTWFAGYENEPKAVDRKKDIMRHTEQPFWPPLSPDEVLLIILVLEGHAILACSRAGDIGALTEQLRIYCKAITESQACADYFAQLSCSPSMTVLSLVPKYSGLLF